MKKLILFFYVLCYQFSFSQSFDAAKIDKALEGVVDGLAPGYAVGVVQNGEIVYEKYAGYANLAHQIPIDEKTKFNIASVAKQFTALCVLNLVLEDKLSLDDDVRKYVPELYKDLKTDLKVRYVLNHSSGIRDYCDLMSIQQKPWWKRMGLDNDDVIEFLSTQKDLNFTPNTDYEYSNSNYTILTKVIEKVSGTSFLEYSKSIFEKLGMNDTHFLKKHMYVISNKALPYSDWGDGIWQQFPMMVNVNGDGALYTTLKDQLTYEQALQKAKGSNNELLTLSQQPIPGNFIEKYGYGLEFNNIFGFHSVDHSGSTGSYNAKVYRFPEQNLSVFALSNGGTWSGSIAEAVAKFILPQNAEKKESKYALQPEKIQDKSANAYIIGEYKNPEGTIIRITENEGDLFWQEANNNPVKLINEEGNLYHWEDSKSLKVHFSINAESSFTVYYPNSAPRLHPKLAPFTATKDYLKEFIGEYSNTEVDVKFSISLNDENELQLHFENKNRSNTIEVIQKDELLLSDYMIKAERNYFNKIESLSVTFWRIRNLKFEKTMTHEANLSRTTADGGAIDVGTTKESYGKGKGDILLTKTNKEGNEEWFTTFGGKGYDRAGSVEITKDGGYIIIGSTSSYGKGNYDVYLIRTDSKGKKIWSETYGEFFNEYGYTVEELENGNFLLKGTKQLCDSNTEFGNCKDYLWWIEVDNKGKLVSEKVEEEHL